MEATTDQRKNYKARSHWIALSSQTNLPKGQPNRRRRLCTLRIGYRDWKGEWTISMQNI